MPASSRVSLAIELLIGDDVIMGTGSVMMASTLLTIRVDKENEDLAVGGVVDLRGEVAAGSLFIVAETMEASQTLP